jgi:Ser/Thr protein kinase RdoA (MazF antagonist)
MRPDVVIKRFRVWHDGRHEREWRALTLLAEHAPALAPMPLAADLSGDPPSVVMSRLGGTPLRAALVTPAQLDAMADAIVSMHKAIPPGVLAGLPPRAGQPAEAVEQARAWYAGRRRVGCAPPVARALDAGWAWLCRNDLGDAGVTPVFGSGDGNLANCLWDGVRVQLVDFEFSGRSDRAFELAEVVEHVSMWVDGVVDVASLLGRFELTRAEAARLRECRRLLAFVWLLMLLGDDPDHPRNPPGTAERQAARLLALLA